MVVRLKNISSRTFTVITSYCIATGMGTSTIAIKTFINVCNDEKIEVATVFVVEN